MSTVRANHNMPLQGKRITGTLSENPACRLKLHIDERYLLGISDQVIQSQSRFIMDKKAVFGSPPTGLLVQYFI